MSNVFEFSYSVLGVWKHIDETYSKFQFDYIIGHVINTSILFEVSQLELV